MSLTNNIASEIQLKLHYHIMFLYKNDWKLNLSSMQAGLWVFPKKVNHVLTLFSIISPDPCVPQNVSAIVSCSSNIATVTWGSSQGAELYTVTASSANGLSANCTSPSTSCDLPTLTCGETYTITVKAKGSNCSSGNSTPVQVQAGLFHISYDSF